VCRCNKARATRHLSKALNKIVSNEHLARPCEQVTLVKSVVRGGVGARDGRLVDDSQAGVTSLRVKESMLRMKIPASWASWSGSSDTYLDDGSLVLGGGKGGFVKLVSGPITLVSVDQHLPWHGKLCLFPRWQQHVLPANVPSTLFPFEGSTCCCCCCCCC
jgi:hypothetical protein